MGSGKKEAFGRQLRRVAAAAVAAAAATAATAAGAAGAGAAAGADDGHGDELGADSLALALYKTRSAVHVSAVWGLKGLLAVQGPQAQLSRRRRRRIDPHLNAQ